MAIRNNRLQPPTISVLIPAFNAERTLQKCLESLRLQKFQPLEIIVVDDCSSDNTASVAKISGARTLVNRKNLGPAVSRNQAAAEAKGEILLFLDADVTVPENLLSDISQILQENQEVAAVQTLYAPFCPEDDIVTRYQNFYYHFSLARLSGNSFAVLATWCVAIRKNVFNKAGGFNSRIPEPTVEDEELGYLLADSGHTISLAKNIQVTHLAKYSLLQFLHRRKRMAKAQAKSGWRSFKTMLLRRYVNVRETGTHHSRWMVLSIILSAVSSLILIPAVIFPLLGISNSFLPLTFSISGLLLSLMCHSPFFKAAVKLFGWKSLPSFIVMSLLDTLVLAWGILTGSLEYILGKKY